jgi:aspartate carbamoyltransferase regulatory subunit
VLNAEPRLISVEGTTKVKIIGFGFVDSKETKSLLNTTEHTLNCQGKDCIKNAEFINTNTLITPTFP